MRCVVFVPIVIPLLLRGEIPPFKAAELIEALDELTDVPKDVFASPEIEIRQAAIRRLTKKQASEFRTKNRIGYFRGLKPFWEVNVVAYSARVKLKSFSIDPRFSKQEAEVFHEQISSEEFGRTIRRWLVAALLAKVGILQFSDVLVTRDGKSLWQRYDDFRGLSSEHLDIAKKMKWPPIKNLRIRSVWRWLQKVPDFKNDFGVSKVGRAVAAFTHLLRRRDPTSEGEILLWALLGLEALYTRGNAELGSQLSAKTQLLLGEQPEFKKAITRMYAYRSRLTHGDVPVPMHYCEYDGLAEYESFVDQVGDQNYLAANVLVSSLQALVTRKSTELSFEWRIAPTKHPRGKSSTAGDR